MHATGHRRLIAALPLAITLAACTSGPAATPTAAPTPTPSPTAAPTPTATPTPRPTPTPDLGQLFSFPTTEAGPWVNFTSPSLDYSLAYPESWIASQDDDGDNFLIAYGSSTFDVILTGSRLVISRHRLSSGESLDDAVDAVAQSRRDELGCDPTIEPIEVDGRDGRLILCTDGTSLFGSYDVVVVRDRTYYDFTLTFDRFMGGFFGTPDDLAVLRQLVTTFRFK